MAYLVRNVENGDQERTSSAAVLDRLRSRSVFPCQNKVECVQCDDQHDKFNLVCAVLDPATSDKMIDIIETLPMNARVTE